MVSGLGFVIAVPAGWDVKRSPGEVSAGKGEDVVSVRTGPLVHPYRAAVARGAAKELDQRAAQLADGLRGKAETSCGGCPKIPRAHGDVLVRGYDIRYGDLVLQMTFVLVDKREYQLSCRRKHDGDTSPCTRLRSSFRLVA